MDQLTREFQDLEIEGNLTMEKRTRCLKIDPQLPFSETLAEAEAVLRAGGLVAFPTETVYGLGANALDPAAVAKIFAAKGRPANNPLIVHVASVEQAKSLCQFWTPAAALLSERFWPGPLTLVLPKAACVPDMTTANGDTVAIRLPAHRVAQKLIEAAGFPLAAPSANRSGMLSPTSAEHVLKGLDGRIDLILDGGPTQDGIESTVVDLSTSPPVLLRPGPIDFEDLRVILPDLQLPTGETPNSLKSPGMLPKHYSPRTPLRLFNKLTDLIKYDRTINVGLLTMEDVELAPFHSCMLVSMPNDPQPYAHRLYEELHRMDEMELELLLVQMPPDTDSWRAVRDRLRRAAES